MLNVLKVLKLLLVSAAYASIFQVVIELKQEEKTVSEERHSKAKQLQTALDQIISSSEHKLKNVSMTLAKLFVDKVREQQCPGGRRRIIRVLRRFEFYTVQLARH